MSADSNKKLILWDVAGTLATFRADLRTQRLAELSGHDGDDMSQRLFAEADSPGIAFDRGEILASEFFDRCCEILGIDNTQENAGRFRHAYADIFEPRPEMGALLEKLAPAYQMWLCSNTNIWHLDKVREVCDYIKRYCFTNCNSYDTGFVKPEPGIFEAAIARSGLAPSDITFVDDRRANIDAAAALGIRVILFTNATELETELTPNSVSA